jgi:hypothetical protein
MSGDLLPCPFCDSAPEILENTDGVIGCLNSECDVKPVASNSAAWNHRSITTAPSGWRPIVHGSIVPADTTLQFWLEFKPEVAALNPDWVWTYEQHYFVGKYGCWGCDKTATHWQWMPQPPKPAGDE